MVRAWFAIAVVACVLGGCGGGGGTGDDTPMPDAPTGHGAVNSITISNDGGSIDIGATKQFSATAKYADGTTCEVGVSCDSSLSITWTATPSDRISINSHGLAL